MAGMAPPHGRRSRHLRSEPAKGRHHTEGHPVCLDGLVCRLLEHRSLHEGNDSQTQRLHGRRLQRFVYEVVKGVALDSRWDWSRRRYRQALDAQPLIPLGGCLGATPGVASVKGAKTPSVDAHVNYRIRGQTLISGQTASDQLQRTDVVASGV